MRNPAACDGDLTKSRPTPVEALELTEMAHPSLQGAGMAGALNTPPSISHWMHGAPGGQALGRLSVQPRQSLEGLMAEECVLKYLSSWNNKTSLEGGPGQCAARCTLLTWTRSPQGNVTLTI